MNLRYDCFAAIERIPRLAAAVTDISNASTAVEKVVAGAAEQNIQPCAAAQVVISVTAQNAICAAPAEDVVIARRANHQLALGGCRIAARQDDQAGEAEGRAFGRLEGVGVNDGCPAA